MTADYDMEDLTFRDLGRAHESLYFAAKRYCAITEQGFVQWASNICADHDPGFVRIGDAAEELAEAGQRYTEAFSRWEAHRPPEDPSDDPENP